MTNPRRLPALDGRALTHGEDDSGRRCLLLEAGDARIHFIYRTAAGSNDLGRGELGPDALFDFVVSLTPTVRRSWRSQI